MIGVLYDTKDVVTGKKKVFYDCCKAIDDVWHWVLAVRNDRNVKNVETMMYVVLHKIINERRKCESLWE